MDEIYISINEYLNDYCLQAEKKYGSFFNSYGRKLVNLATAVKKIIKTSPNIKEELSHPKISVTHLPYLSYPESMNIVQKYIKKYLTKYQNLFEECLNNGTTNIVFDPSAAENKNMKDSEGRNKNDTHFFINVLLRHNYLDPIIIMHEFIHYLNNHTVRKVNPVSQSLLTEAISIFFELDILKFMLEEGYDKTSLSKIVIARLKHLASYSDSIMLDFMMINMYNCLGNLTPNSNKEAKDLNLNPRYEEEAHYLFDSYTFYNKIKDPAKVHRPHVNLSYFLGITLAISLQEKDDSTIREKFLALNAAVEDKSFSECLKLIDVDMTNQKSMEELITNFYKATKKIDAAVLKVNKKSSSNEASLSHK